MGWGKIDVYKGSLDILGILPHGERIRGEAPQEGVSVAAQRYERKFPCPLGGGPRFVQHPCVHDAFGRHLYGEKVDSPASVDYAAFGKCPARRLFIRIDGAGYGGAWKEIPITRTQSGRVYSR